MEITETGVPQSDEGTRPEPAVCNEEAVSLTLKFTEPDTCFGSPLVASVVADTPQEVQRAEVDLGETANPTPDVEAPKGPITESQLRALRGKYFTVRHIPLTDCGHKMDVINEPRHRNCSNCFWQWVNFHPKLVETVDEAWREHGKEFIIRLRGKHFAKQFGRYMSTVSHFREQERQLALQNQKSAGENIRQIEGVAEDSQAGQEPTHIVES